MRLRNLEKFKTGGAGNNMQLSIPLPKTPEGRIYRYSPNENAHPRHFLLGERVPAFVLPETLTPRITHAPGSPGTICPYSGTLGDDGDFTHPDDIAAAKEVVAHAFHTDAASAIHGMFDDLARQHSGSKFLKITTGQGPRQSRRRDLRAATCCARWYAMNADATTVFTRFHCSAPTAARRTSICTLRARSRWCTNRSNSRASWAPGKANSLTD